MVSELSILIPVFNRTVIDLVQALVKQVDNISIPVEVRVYDDGSLPAFKEVNQLLFTVANVIYKELPANVGRSQIRYLLAQEAQFATLLFLDNDVLPVYPDFLQKYVHHHPGGVTVGGLTYQETPPAPDQRLRWLYGKEREQAKAEQRSKKPYERVFLSNLVVERALFLKYFKRDLVTGYGHEDTLFAGELQKHHIQVSHLENLVVHLGLDTTPVFLEKTKKAIQNLVLLQKAGHIKNESRLLQVYFRLKASGLIYLLKANKFWLMPLVRQRLHSATPSLKLFDLYRLLLLDQYMNK